MIFIIEPRRYFRVDAMLPHETAWFDLVDITPDFCDTTNRWLRVGVNDIGNNMSYGQGILWTKPGLPRREDYEPQIPWLLTQIRMAIELGLTPENNLVQAKFLKGQFAPTPEIKHD